MAQLLHRTLIGIFLSKEIAYRKEFLSNYE